MSGSVVELYSPQRLARLDRRRGIVKRLLWALALAALAVCVFLTSRVNTHNIYKMLLSCICVSVGTAWIIIYFGTYMVRDAGRELEHAAFLAEGERELVEGRVVPLKLKVRIRNSVTLRKIRVETAAGNRDLSIDIDKAPQLRRAGEYLRLYVSHGYIVAYEVTDHANS